MDGLRVALVAGVALIALTLQGCGGGGGGPTPAPSPAPTPAPAPTPTPPPGWNLNPIVIKGSHMYDSSTGKLFNAKGIAFPNVVDSVDSQGNPTIDEHINVLDRIASLGPDINAVRLYIPPLCAIQYVTGKQTVNCLIEFMHTADQHGIYVVVPGTGTEYGDIPRWADCEPQTANGCYKSGDVLGFGQQMLQAWNFPNTLALVVGNENAMNHLELLPVIKAYARDLKSYMDMCNTYSQSPSYQQMRQIPLMYAAADTSVNTVEYYREKAQYLFCGNWSNSVDIFGLNNERWCTSTGGAREYQGISAWVTEQKFPGPFLHSEEGCSVQAYSAGYRDWAQLPNFFQNYPGIDGFFAYTYYGNPNFNMFDSATATATENQDGKQFFSQVKTIGGGSSVSQVDVTWPQCATSLYGTDIDSLYNVREYDTGPTGRAPNCPKPAPPFNIERVTDEALDVTGVSV